MVGAAASLAVDFPGRFTVLVILSVAVMLAAEYRPRALLGGAVACWIGIGWIGVGAYALGLLDVASRPALTAVLAVGIVATIAAAVLASRRRPAPEEPSGSGARPGWRRAVLPTLIGLTGGLLAVRASIEPVTQWDAVVTNLSFARDWLQSLPGLPHAAGPSAGAEVSYNQPALFPAVGVAVAAPLHVDVADVARLVSPLAAVTLLATLRLIGSRSGLAAWAPSMFLLGSTLFVAYGQWPTSYMLVLVLLTLAVALLAADRRLSLPAAALIGLAAGAALIGFFLAAIVLGVYVGCRAGRKRPTVSGRGAGLVALLVGPLAIVVAASLDRTRSLLFPWLTWPGGGHLLPQPEWAAAEHVLVANRYGHPNVDLGDYLNAVRGIATSSALAPGSVLAACAVVAACAVTIAARRRTVRVAAGAVLVAALLLVAIQLVRLGDFLPVTIALAVAIGAVMGALAVERGPIRLNAVARAVAVVGVAACLASGAAYAVAGPNDRTSTASTNYRGAHVSAFERARTAADPGRGSTSSSAAMPGHGTTSNRSAPAGWRSAPSTSAATTRATGLPSSSTDAREPRSGVTPDRGLRGS